MVTKDRRFNVRSFAQENPSKGGMLKSLTTYRVPPQVEPEAVRLYLEALDCPRSLTVWILYNSKEYAQLANLGFRPSDYETADVSPAYSATLLFGKYQDFKHPDLDRKKTALEKFDRFELQCKATNERFRRLCCCPLYTGATVWLHDAVRRKISKILGSFNGSEWLERANWGPGATTLLKRSDACAENKFQREVGITRDLLDLITDPDYFSALGFSPLWWEAVGKEFPQYSTGNRLEFVPKSSKTDRPISIEPGLNLWFQKGIGSMIRLRLRKCGIDLNDQSVNQRLALIGSLTGLLGTVDFSSASDSIALELVRDLLPPEWFFVMDRCRSHFGNYQGKVRKWEKFSSMGNGFTFELESLIFFAMACCCNDFVGEPTVVGRNTSVYGDDVILPIVSFDHFSNLSRFYGLTINTEKTFVSSPFRESCGEHYCGGLRVTPIYLKGRLTGILSLFRFHNSIRRRAFNRGYGCDSIFERCCRYLIRSCPKPLRLRIPENLGDGGFISNLDEATPSRVGYQLEGWLALNLVEVSIPHRFDGLGLLLNSLWRLEHKSLGVNTHRGPSDPMDSGELYNYLAEQRSNDHYSPSRPKVVGNFVFKKESTRLKLTKSLVHCWADLGPWI